MISVRRDLSLWIQCGCTALVALGAAYAYCIHGRHFALRFGADKMTASIWPLIVDGLLTTATVELWKPNHDDASRRAAWAPFLFGISLSLCANIASAPVTSVFRVAVAACPSLALLLAVELLNRALNATALNHRCPHPPTAFARNPNPSRQLRSSLGRRHQTRRTSRPSPPQNI